MSLRGTGGPVRWRRWSRRAWAGRRCGPAPAAPARPTSIRPRVVAVPAPAVDALVPVFAVVFVVRLPAAGARPPRVPAAAGPRHAAARPLFAVLRATDRGPRRFGAGARRVRAFGELP